MCLVTADLWSEEHQRALLGTYGVCVLPRDGSDVASLISSDPLLAHYKNDIRIAQEAVGFPVSSTTIRSLLLAGKSARYLTPDETLAYIARHKLWSKTNA